ncbi:AraC family transcriptional regulator [Paenibacillus sp. FSL R7-0273]|uniref:helix-turn-helix domain-containing protein n=1 Tax=Paenibacillus sp. FSL R7-0273 TaxID=1536772 RepID=UPI0004F6B803|nr:helix-turn-helix domain-containing protein [Paenibacillus sp. FSL R7-0273]AIQ47914.1 AraC family transcriptional regulator [Paenibacillus sp. FSL R7-0273]OMF94536.1 AraC family transcriptional regulator [Paenibacillus sp. FSL R7-0273]
MKKGRMFYGIFIPILILGVGLVASFGSYIYISTIRSVVGQFSSSKQSYVEQIKNNLEHKIQSIEYAFNTFSTTSSFQDLVTNPITVKDFEAYRSVNSQLNYIASMTAEGTEYSLISLEQNWQIMNERLTSLSEDDVEQLREQYIVSQNQSLFWIKTDKGIRFVNTLPVFSSKKQAIALSDISQHTLDSIIKTDEKAQVYILNKSGELLYDSGQRETSLTPGQLAELSGRVAAGEENGKTEIELGGHQPLQLLYSKSSYNNWIYLTGLDQEEIAGTLKLTKFGLVALGLLSILLILVVAYVVATYFTKPIQRIKSSLSVVPAVNTKNEFEYIIHSIDTILSEKESLASLINAEMPQLETQLLHNLLRNRETPEDLEKNLQRFGYPPNGSQIYTVMLIQLDSLGGQGSSDTDVLLLAINKMVEEVIPKPQRLQPIILNDDTQATILAMPEQSGQELNKELLEYATALIKAVRNYLKIPISIGFSNSYTDLLESKEACQMSKQALHQRLNLGKESIIFYEDISKVVSGPVLLHYPAELESQLFNGIRLGDREQVTEALYPFLAQLIGKNKSTLNFEVMLVRLVNNLIQLEQHLGLQVLLTRDNNKLYHRVLDIRNPEEIEHLLVHEVIYPMTCAMKEKTSKQFRSLSDQITAIIHSEFDQELTLEGIGERLHYNPNYLSSIFKKEYGTSFSEYLMNYRLEMAKKWLSETDMTIREIAERLQYHNPQNFIRSFRKKEQVTPGTYRKLQQEA